MPGNILHVHHKESILQHCAFFASFIMAFGAAFVSTECAIPKRESEEVVGFAMGQTNGACVFIEILRWGGPVRLY